MYESPDSHKTRKGAKKKKELDELAGTLKPSGKKMPTTVRGCDDSTK